MTLLDSEIDRIKAELGFNVLSVGAEPYVGVTRYFEQVAIPNLSAAAVTTSATAVTAAATPTAVTLTLTSATGFAMFARVILDVDDATEFATVRAVSGNTISVSLAKAHSGTYPVCVESGETLVRYYLAKCRDTLEKIDRSGSTAGIKSADKQDVVFFGGEGERSRIQTLGDLLGYWRSELCKLLFGVGSIAELMAGGGAGGLRGVALY